MLKIWSCYKKKNTRNNLGVFSQNQNSEFRGSCRKTNTLKFSGSSHKNNTQNV